MVARMVFQGGRAFFSGKLVGNARILRERDKRERERELSMCSCMEAFHCKKYLAPNEAFRKSLGSWFNGVCLW